MSWSVMPCHLFGLPEGQREELGAGGGIGAQLPVQRRRPKELTSAEVRAWRQGLLDKGMGESTVSKADRFLRTVVDDDVVPRNPVVAKEPAVSIPVGVPF
ncbi:MAG: hypothetical protein H0V49_07320 [Nocardioidaceae bacterium]|nr:hypothetical protein [Nocardioidaceae bacterium]